MCRSAFMVVGAKHGVTVGEVEKQHTSQARFLSLLAATLMVSMVRALRLCILENRRAARNGA